MDYQELSWTTRAGVIIDYHGDRNYHGLPWQELSWTSRPGFNMNYQDRSYHVPPVQQLSYTTRATFIPVKKLSWIQSTYISWTIRAATLIN